MLPREAVIEYQDIYKKLDGVILSFEEASEYANKLFNFVELVTKPSELKQ